MTTPAPQGDNTHHSTDEWLTMIRYATPHDVPGLLTAALDDGVTPATLAKAFSLPLDLVLSHMPNRTHICRQERSVINADTEVAILEDRLERARQRRSAATKRAVDAGVARYSIARHVGRTASSVQRW